MALSLGVLVSGNGTNLQAIIDAIESKKLNAKIEIVLSDNPKAYALERAKKHHLDHQLISRKDFSTPLEFEAKILQALQQKKVEWVVLAGFMRLLSPRFIQTYPKRILNIHPSLLPSFPGLNAIGQAYHHGVKVTGCTVHLVDEGCDTGPILAQKNGRGFIE